MLPSEREVRIVCVLMIGAALALQTASLIRGARGGPLFGHELGSDFACFYSAARILNEHSGASLYDLKLQDRLYHAVIPYADPARALPYAYPPFVAAAFRPLGYLPFAWAYAAWLAAGAGLYALGLYLICPPALPPRTRATAVLVAASFSPFLFEAWGGGQLTAIGFAALAAAIRLERSGRPFLAGCAAGICLYKPTLLVIMLPLFAIARRWRMLAGVFAGAAALVAAGIAGAGLDAFRGYPAVAGLYRRLLAETPWVFQEDKFIDLNTFIRLLPGGNSVVGKGIFLLAAAGAFSLGAWLWARYNACGPEGRAACWAAALPLTLLASVYAPIYDATLVVLSGFLIAGIVYTPEHARFAAAFEALTLVLYLAAIASQPLARVLHVQIVTIALAAFAGFAAYLAFDQGSSACKPRNA
ncbi:MAG: glycosyltransferase family 87 protein [Acidobacteriota bacterium]